MPSVSAGRREGAAADPIRRGARALRSDFGLDVERFGATSVWKVCTAVGRVAAPGRASSAAGFKTRVSARTGAVLSEATVRPTAQAAPSIMRTPASVSASSARRADSRRTTGAIRSRDLLRDAAPALTWRLRLEHGWTGGGRRNQRSGRPSFTELVQDRVHGGRPLIRFLRQHSRQQVGQPRGHFRTALFE